MFYLSAKTLLCFADCHGLSGRHFEPEVLLEMENDEVDHLRHDPDRNLRRGRCCDRKVIDVQHQLRQRPITISDNYNVDEKESQLRRGRPGPRRDATNRNKQAGENTLDPNQVSSKCGLLRKL